MKKTTNMLKVIGITEDKKEVVSGIGHFYFQEGLPLSFIFDELQRENMIPSWLHLYRELVENGMTHNRIMHLLSEHIFESYGSEMRDRTIQILEYKYFIQQKLGNNHAV